MTKLQISKKETSHSQKKAKEKEENEDILKAKVNSLESIKTELEKRTMKYGEAILLMRNTQTNNPVVNESNLAKSIKEKTKKIKEYETINKNLVTQLQSLQESNNPENFNKVTEELEKKKRELKNTKDSLRKAEERSKSLLGNVII